MASYDPSSEIDLVFDESDQVGSYSRSSSSSLSAGSRVSERGSFEGEDENDAELKPLNSEGHFPNYREGSISLLSLCFFVWECI